MDSNDKMYIYRITFNNSDSYTIYHCSTVKDICDKLNLSRSVINNIMKNKIKKYNFMTIEKIQTINLPKEEARKEQIRKNLKKYQEKQKDIKRKEKDGALRSKITQLIMAT